MIRITLIVVTYNSKKFLPELLQSIKALDATGLIFKTIIVDNASQDGSREYLQKNTQIELITNYKNLGFAEGNNIAMNQALTDGTNYIMLINPDTVIEPNCLKELITTMESNPKIGAAQALLLLWPPQKQLVNSWGNELQFLGFGYTGGYGQPLTQIPTKIRQIAYASGAAVCYRANALRAVGLFDPTYFIYHEDTELSLKLRLAGWQIVLAPTAKVYHKYEPQKSTPTLEFIERNRLRILIEFFKLPTLLLLLPALIISELGLIVLSWFSPTGSRRSKIYGWLIKHWRQLIIKRHQISSIRCISDRELCKLLTDRINFEIAPHRWLLKFINPFFVFYWKITKLLLWW